MGAILVAERSLCYHGQLGTCSRCGQPRQRLQNGLCLACRQKAQREQRRPRPAPGKLGLCGHPVSGRKRICDKCAERRYRENNARQVAKCAARRVAQ